jgi:Ca2+-binding RTX toxin-like protein
VVEGKDHFGAVASTTFRITVNSTNDAPEVGTLLNGQQAQEDAAFVYALPADSFRDVNAGDMLSFSVSLENGNPLPDWLSFNAQTQTFSGTPNNLDVGNLQVRVTATDLAGASVAQVLLLQVTNTNDAPTIGSALADQQATEDASFVFTVPRDTFRDEDVGDGLSYQAVLSDGSTLPGWLVFDASTVSFSGVPGRPDVGSIEVKIIAIDQSGATVADNFLIAINASTTTEPGLTLIGDWRNNRLIGGAGNDVAYGNGGSDYISLFGGNNQVHGSYGNDIILTGSGDDAIHGGGGSDQIEAGAGQNRVYAGWGDDTINTGAGDDIIEAGGGRNQVTSGAGNDRITSLWGDDSIDAGSGNNVISAGGGNNRIVAGSGNDVIATETGNDIIHAGDGDNVIDASEGNNQIFSGQGRDIIRAFGVNLVQSGAGNDDITLGWGADTIDAGAGDDVIRAGGGGDLVRGGAGNDLIVSNQWSNDTYVFARHDGRDIISDDGGADILHFEDINRDELLFQRVGDDLQIDIVAQQDGVTVKGWYSKPSGKIEQIKTGDGQVLNESQVGELVSARVVRAQSIRLNDRKNNEGVGNALDASPPGHGSNDNAGAGSSLGTPRRQSASGRNDDVLDRFLDSFKNDGKSAHSGLPALDRSWFAQRDEHQSPFEPLGQGQGNNDIQRHWSELTQALNRLDVERQGGPAWSHPNQGADLSGLTGWMQGGPLGARGGVDTVSLVGGSGTQLKTFTGLKEGFGKLPW